MQSLILGAQLSLYLVVMERAGVTPLSSGAPAEGGPTAPMDQSLAKRKRPPSEAEQVRATQVVPHGPWLSRPTPRRFQAGGELNFQHNSQ